MESDARARGTSPTGEWWLRTLTVLTNPVSTFQALRDDSEEAASAREEPVLAIVLLAGIAGILATPAYVGNLLDDPARDGIVVAVLLFLTGALYGAATYWIGGGALALGIRSAGGESNYRHARHILAYSAVPTVLSLAVWLVALAAYGGDLFRSGGADEHGAGHWLLPVGQAVFFAWSFVLLVVGVRTVHDWVVTRSLGAIALAVLALLGLGLAFSVL
jgi:hypothetical protein